MITDRDPGDEDDTISRLQRVTGRALDWLGRDWGMDRIIESDDAMRERMRRTIMARR